MSHHLAVVLIGPSGGGKSSTITAVTKTGKTEGITFIHLRKDTTRSRRSAAEADEFEFIGRECFEQRKRSGQYLVAYESYGEWYAVQRFDAAKIGEAIPILAIPASHVESFREALGGDFKVLVCSLEVSPETVRLRLQGRGDEGTLRYMEQRAATAHRNRSSLSDIALDGEKPIQSIAADLVSAVAKEKARNGNR